MMRKNIFRFFAAVGLFALAAAQVGCLDDLYKSSLNNSKLPDDVFEFGFKTRSDVKLKVNYNAPIHALIEVYAENPIVDGVKKAGLKPVFVAYTDAKGAFNNTMYVPTSLRQAWLYTANFGLPQSVQLAVANGAFVYDINGTSVKSTRAEDPNILKDGFRGERAPFDLLYNNGTWVYKTGAMGLTELKSLVKWNENTNISAGYSTQTNTDGLGNEPVGEIASRVANYIGASDDKPSFLRPASVTNIVITEDATNLSLVFLGDRAAFRNTVGYYYYKTGSAPKTKNEFFLLPTKFVTAPDASTKAGNIGMNIGQTVELQFFGNDNETAGTTAFPKGYTVGWFFISDGMNPHSGSYPRVRLVDPYFDKMPTMFFSDDVGDRCRFIAVKDAKSGILVLGFEDQFILDASSEDYCDVLFYVKSNKDITNPDRPEIPDEDEDKEVTEIIEGTLCFEDIWPNGGDYDMNDVAVEYSRVFISDKNGNAKKVTETFKAVQPNGSASHDNYFAYRANTLGKVTLPNQGVIQETETNSIVFSAGAKNSVGQVFTVVREFTGTVKVEEVKKDFDPYIIVTTSGYTTEKRKEVHLPKQSPTIFADKSLSNTADDAYYINVKGKYAFAIDIPVLDFVLATEKASIDSETQYPNFAKWATSKGESFQDWFLKNSQRC